MRITRSIASVALVAALGSGCGATTTTAVPTNVSTPAPSPAIVVAPQAPSPTVAPPTAPTETPSPTPVASIDAKAPATVSGTQAIGAVVKPETWAKVDGVRQQRGREESIVLSLSDPRVNGTAYTRLDADYYETGPGTEVATMWGDMRIDAPSGGTWKGPCTGGIWVYQRFSIVCWLGGTGPYEGMTFYYSLLHVTEGDLVVDGLIYPGLPPEP